MLCIITGPSECGKSVFLTNLNLIFIKEYDKLYTYSPSLHEDLFQKLKTCFSNYIPIHIIPNILNEEENDELIEKIVNIKDFQKPVIEIETFENILELKYPQEYKSKQTIIIIFDDLNQKKGKILEFKQCSNALDTKTIHFL